MKRSSTSFRLASQRVRRTVALASLLAAALAASSPAGVPAAQLRPFSDGGIWNAPLAPVTPIDLNSARLVAELGREVAREQLARTGPWINSTAATTTVYTVPASQPLVPVRLVDHRDDPVLTQAWSAVPVPPDAKPSPGDDREITIWQPSTDRLWEFWHFARAASGGWQAQWGGAMSRVHTNAGYFSPNAWPGGKPWWGATATSLPLLGGLIRTAELRAGRIDHALALAVPHTRAGVYRWPAQRTDGTTTGVTSLPEGTRLRLDPTLDVAALRLPPTTAALALAAQRYGILVRDTAPNIAFYAEAPTAADPYNGVTGVYGGKRPDQLLARFPWGQLQVVKYGP